MVDKARRRRGGKGEGHGSKSKSETGEKNSGETTEMAAKGHQKSLLIHFTDDAPTWYSCGRQTPGRDDTVSSDPPSSEDLKVSHFLSRYRSEADELFRREVHNFGHSGSSDERWVENTMKRGTLKDRIAAMSVVVSTNPVHKFYALDGLLQMAGCSLGGQTNARMAQMASEAIEDLFLNTFLPPNRKLIPLDQRPLYRYERQKTLSPRILLLWRYEEMVKEKYQLFLSQYLARTLKDGMEMSKLSALRTVSSLLRSNAEGEEQLLSMMVNKLGDPSKKIASTAAHELRRVLEEHANMQNVIAREVQQLAHRPNLSPRALYNCITFLNQLQLTERPTTNGATDSKFGRQASLPASLINTFFRLFEVAVTKSRTADSETAGMKSRLLSALLTGVNRAYPYLPKKDKALEDHIDSLYRVVHTGPPSASTQALRLLFHVAVGSEPANTKDIGRQDRFYRALYSTMSQTSIVSAGKHLTLYFNLLYKAMKYDTKPPRVVAFAKRLLSTTLHSSPPVTAASFFLISEIMKYHPDLERCFVDVAEGRDAVAILDAAKREPAMALTIEGPSLKSDEELITRAPLWEASLAAFHFHPSVTKFATTLGEITYTGDPLRNFSLQPFLDRFAYRNPKTSTKLKRGESVAERRSGMEGTEQALSALPVNDPSFLEKTDINEQDEFFHAFFVERARRDEMKGVARSKSDDGEEVEGENEAFDMAENMIDLDHRFEKGWDTDEEEEAFVDSLAEKLMEDVAVELDDEDPDMEGWDGMHSDEEEPTTEADVSESAYEDAYMDGIDDGSDVDSEEVPIFDGDIGEGGDDFMDVVDEESDSDNEQVDLHNPRNEDDDSEDDLALVGDSDSDDEDEAVPAKKSKTKKDEVIFVDAAEYEETINKSWREIERPKGPDGHDNEVHVTEAGPSSTGCKKRKRRPKKKRSESMSYF